MLLVSASYFPKYPMLKSKMKHFTHPPFLMEALQISMPSMTFMPLSCGLNQFPPPLPHSKLRTVQKMMVGGQQATGIVPLMDIKFSCELSPVLGESFWDGTGDQDVDNSSSLDMFDTFYLNCFGGHLDSDVFG